MVAIELQNAAPEFNIPDESEFQSWAKKIDTSENDQQIVALRIVDEEEMSKLNSQYRQKAGPTNVLSFPADLHEEIDIPFIGDVVVCAPVVIKESVDQGKSEISHWAHMTVHGILHLQGYDHINETDAEQMESIEIRVMNELGFENPYK